MPTLHSIWGEPPAQTVASYDQIHVWRASLDQPTEQVRGLAESLSADERERAARFHFERDQRRFVVGRGVLRAVLGSYLEIPASHIQLSYGPQGKPVLFSDSGQVSSLHFNLAHADGLALYAVTRDRELGIDIERIRPIPETARIAEQFFSAQEREALAALPEEQRQEAFFRCWTRKEAYLKAVGEGLARPLDQIQVSLAPGEPARILGDSQEAERWCLREVIPADGYIAALAVEGHGWGLSCWQWAG